MGKRWLVSSVVAAAITIVALTVPVAGQSQAPAAKAPAAKTAVKPWAAPKMPWGHPDISGTWTSDGAIGIPRERPDQFAGRVELTDSEFADKLKT